jgi:rhodanese-related sulfurtransferase
MEVAKMSANVQNAPEPLRITAKEVIERMNRGEDVYFVDTRNPQAWAEADTKLPGAVRVPADAVEPHLADMPRDRMIVAYCT